MTTDPADDGIARIMARSQFLKGFTPLELGAAPNPAEMTAEEMGEYDDDHLEELAQLTLEERERRLQQARLLARALRTASVIMVDHSFEDLKICFTTRQHQHRGHRHHVDTGQPSAPIRPPLRPPVCAEGHRRHDRSHDVAGPVMAGTWLRGQGVGTAVPARGGSDCGRALRPGPAR